MHIWNWITGLFDTGPNITSDTTSMHHADHNPATGLPMIGGIGGVDAGGSPFGHEVHQWHDDHRWTSVSAAPFGGTHGANPWEH